MTTGTPETDLVASVPQSGVLTPGSVGRPRRAITETSDEQWDAYAEAEALHRAGAAESARAFHAEASLATQEAKLAEALALTDTWEASEHPEGMFETDQAVAGVRKALRPRRVAKAPEGEWPESGDVDVLRLAAYTETVRADRAEAALATALAKVARLTQMASAWSQRWPGGKINAPMTIEGVRMVIRPGKNYFSSIVAQHTEPTVP